MTEIMKLHKPADRFYRFFGIRATLIGITLILLLLSLVLVLYSMHTLNNMRTAMNRLATQDLSDLVMFQRITDELRILNDDLQEIPFIGNNRERQQAIAKINRLVAGMRAKLQQMSAMNKESVTDEQNTAIRYLDDGLKLFDLSVKRFDQITNQRIIAKEEFKTRLDRIDRVYNDFITASEDANRQMRALVSRALAVNIPDAARQDRLYQELDAFLERENSWLGTSQDLRNDGRELKAIAVMVSTETFPAAIDKLDIQAAAVYRRLFLHKLLPATPVVGRLAAVINELTGQISGKHPTLFSIRKTEIEMEKQAQTLYNHILEMSRNLRQDAARIEEMNSNKVQLAVQTTNSNIISATKFLLGFSLAGAVFSVLALYYLVGIRIIRRIEGLTKYMRLSASEAERGEPGRLEGNIRKLIGGGHDEIAAMGKAFTVFIDAILAEKNFSETVVNSLPGIFYMCDRQGRFVSWNKNIEVIFGYTREEIKESNIFALTAEYDRARVQNAIERVFEERYEDFEADLITKSGKPIPYYLTGVLITKGLTSNLAVTGIDLTELKKSEKALRESENRFRGMIEQAAVGVAEIDMNTGRFLTVNERLCTMLGRTEDEMLATTFREITHPEDFHLHENKIQTMVEGNIWHYTLENRCLRKDGEIVWVNITMSPLWRPAGASGRNIAVVEDITDRKLMEKEKQNLEDRLNRAEKMESLGILAGGVAHDLNNVLGIMVGYAEMLLRKTDNSSPIRSKLISIMEGGQKAAAIVQDMLTLTRRGVSGRSVLNLNSVITDCMKSPEFENLSFHHFAVKFKTELSTDLPNISASSVHLNKTLFNLISNACEAMKKGGCVTIKTMSQYLDKPIQGYDKINEGDYVVLSMSDTGEGIHPDDLKRIFEPFYTKKVMGRSGTGLGLAVVWGTMKDHDGYINVQSQEGKGSAFTLYFPVTREELSGKDLPVSVSEYMGKGESILIVDDVKGQRDLAEEMLSKLNYNVKSVSSGEEAVAYLKKHKMDLIVLDMIMDPGMDGLDTYRSVLEICPRQKAIIVSGFSESDRVKIAQFLGAGTYVKKPYVLENLGIATRKELDRTS